jgi:hypothetical protein
MAGTAKAIFVMMERATMINLKEMSVQYVTDTSGARNAVILSLDTFNALIEDIQDLATVAERLDEPTISHQQLMKVLKADGFLSD